MARIPNRAARRARSARPPSAAVLTLARTYRARIDRLAAETFRLLGPVLGSAYAPTLESPPDDDDARTRVDATPEIIRRKLGLVDLQLGEVLRDEALLADSSIAAKRVLDQNGRELRRVLGVSFRTTDSRIAPLIDTFRAANVSKIKSLGGQALVEVTRILDRAEGLRVEDIRAAIQERFDVAKSRADLIARDQVLKLNGQVTQTRMQNAGIREYIWTTSGDERVRAEHADLDGTRQSWDSPPVALADGSRGHPGQLFQCRCTAFPVVPALDE